MKFAADFESFLRIEVNLNQTRLDLLQQRVNTIETFISNHATFGDMFVDVIPAGSWAYRTIIKPVSTNDEFDADLLVSLQEQEDWQPKDYIENLYKSFHDNVTYKSLAQRMTRCVRIDYAGDFHIDVVPYLERSSGNVITNRTKPAGEGRFEASNPEGMTQWIDERQRLTKGTFVKVVRLVKYLRDFKNTFSCKSIILTTLLGSEVNEIEASFFPNRYADVPSTFTTLLEKLAASLPESMPAVMDPAGTGDNFTDRYSDDWNYPNFRSTIVRYAAKARAAYDEDDRDKSLALWRDLFGDQFRPETLTKAASLAPLSSSVPWTGEQFIDQQPYGFAFKLDPATRVRIRGRCTGMSVGTVRRRNGFRTFDLPNSGNRVPKQRSLRFDAATNSPLPYELYWKVRNGGSEANSSAALRGEIRKDSGGNSRTGTTLYKGTHYVECYVVREGVVVATDHQTVIVTEL